MNKSHFCGYILLASFLQHYFKQNNTLMKNAIKSIHYKLVFLSFCMIAGIAAFAQDPATTASSNTSSSNTTTSVTTPAIPANWYMNPWVWLAGGVVLVLILFAIFRSGNSKREVTRTVTTSTEIND